MAYETYTAVANKAQARDLAATESPFTIEVRFLGGLNARQKAAFTAAADRWVKAIVGDLPPVRIGEDVIDDILIEAQGRPIDGPGKILGQAHSRSGRGASLATFVTTNRSLLLETGLAMGRQSLSDYQAFRANSR